MMGNLDAPRWIKSTSISEQQLTYPLGEAVRSLFAHSIPQGPSPFLHVFVVVVYGTHLWQDKAGSLTGVSWRLGNSRDASPTMMGKCGTPRWAKPISVPDQRFIYPLGGARRSVLAHLEPRGLRIYLIKRQVYIPDIMNIETLGSLFDMQELLNITNSKVESCSGNMNLEKRCVKWVWV